MKLTTKEVKEVLKYHGITVINPTISFNDDKTSVLLEGYNKNGFIYTIYVDCKFRYATRQMLSRVALHSEQDISKWFF